MDKHGVVTPTSLSRTTCHPNSRASGVADRGVRETMANRSRCSEPRKRTVYFVHTVQTHAPVQGYFQSSRKQTCHIFHLGNEEHQSTARRYFRERIHRPAYTQIRGLIHESLVFHICSSKLHNLDNYNHIVTNNVCVPLSCWLHTPPTAYLT